MIRLKPAIGTCILASAFLPTVAAHATSYYVSTTGNDSNNGSEATPWRTVVKAVDTMVAGDTTYVKSGTYLETSSVWFKKTGTQAAPIKLLNYPGQAPIIDFANATDLYQRILIQNSQGANKPIGWITIEGFEVRNGKVGLHSSSLHDAVIRRNWFHDSDGGSCILGYGTRILIDRNIVSHCAILDPTPPGGHGIYMNGTAITITNNLIYDNRSYGITLNGTSSYTSTKHPGPEYARSDNWVIAHNTFAYSNGSAAIVHWGSQNNNTRIENNIFYENCVKCAANNPNAINFYNSYPTGVTVRNNLSYASGSGGALFIVSNSAQEGVQYTQSANIVNADHPRFVNAPATLPELPDFALTSGSPAIDRGLSLTTLGIAFNGTTRPQGRAYDIGAHEYNADGDSQSPRPVQNVQVH